MKKPVCTYDDDQHRYTIDGFVVPHVTGILDSILPLSFKPHPWYMDKGKANHACYAMLAAGEEFECDPVCEPYVEAWKAWRDGHQVKPIAWEFQVFNLKLMYAGTLDLHAVVDGVECIVDYKGTLTGREEYQLGLYSMAYGRGPKTGLAVEFRTDGTAPLMRWYDLRKSVSECNALLTVYGLKHKLGIVNK